MPSGMNPAVGCVDAVATGAQPHGVGRVGQTGGTFPRVDYVAHVDGADWTDGVRFFASRQGTEMEYERAARLLVGVGGALDRPFVDVGDGKVDAESVGMEINTIPHRSQLGAIQALALDCA